MTTITIDLPEPLVDELHERNVSKERLNAVVQILLEHWLSTQLFSLFDDYFADTNSTQLAQTDEQAQLVLMERAATDSLFLADVQEVMTDFAYADAEWWELEK
ncbi:MAG: hypothetical protein AAF639_10785 [Chloroflexota bacterium]